MLQKLKNLENPKFLEISNKLKFRYLSVPGQYDNQFSHKNHRYYPTLY